MITVKNVVRPSTTAEAYEALQSHKFATLLGGGAFLRMGSKNVSTLIDLSQCGLDTINEKEDEFEIGAMVTLGELERHEGIHQAFDGLIRGSVKDIVGVQMRNIVTTGATVYARYGFSDLITGLLALPTRVKLHHKGIMSLEDFLEMGSGSRDLLESVIISREKCTACTLSVRKTAGDYALLNTAVACYGAGGTKISVGARPGRACLAVRAMGVLQGTAWSQEMVEEAARTAAEELVFGTNSRAAGAYRQQLCRVLVRRALEEVMRREAEHKD